MSGYVSSMSETFANEEEVFFYSQLMLRKQKFALFTLHSKWTEGLCYIFIFVH